MTPSPDVPRAATRTAMDAAKPDWLDECVRHTKNWHDSLAAMGLESNKLGTSDALLAANAELARVREELEKRKEQDRGDIAETYRSQFIAANARREEAENELARLRADWNAREPQLLSAERELEEERALADDLAKALEKVLDTFGLDLFGSDGDDNPGTSAKAALERHRGARG